VNARPTRQALLQAQLLNHAENRVHGSSIASDALLSWSDLPTSEFDEL